jgi:hypothetical protein
MYEQPQSVKHKISVKSLKKCEIRNTTDGTTAAVFGKSDSLTNNASHDECGNSNEDVWGFYAIYKLHSALSLS